MVGICCITRLLGVAFLENEFRYVPWKAEGGWGGAGEIDVLPWNEMESLHSETGTIKNEIVALNKAGFLTINSQPRVNGASSSDPSVGWGGENG